ncbi:MAG: glycoside hydrolase family 3 C-terminal domain-containing protein [Clostridiales Family XIII bacterium]|jgi:beta-glucosidase|nr:glycoside hydrolase family 3 C-terminal domain-containing protein [Clostridiales Family XIII bacterium]
MNAIKRTTDKIIANLINNVVQITIPDVEDGLGTTPELQKLARELGGEGCVLLKNDGVLPLSPSQSIAVFGRVQYNYFYVGYGSGGEVKAPYRVSLIEGLENADLTIDEEVKSQYKEWTEKNVPNDGYWAHWPTNYEEMPLSDKFVTDAASRSDTAIVVIGRSAGEERENKLAKGSWYLTNKERDMLSKVSKAFQKVCVILNTGTIIDMHWVKEFSIDAVLYAWQGGQESGNAVTDVLTGKVNPSGKLTDTIAFYEDYPSSKDFGAKDYNNYTEDIYVGYRYFETFARDKVTYPFGFGLSYTEFDVKTETLEILEETGQIKVAVTVANAGNYAGKEVVQLYYSAPQGLLGKPVRELAAYKKTRLLQPGESDFLELIFDIDDMASYDDSGKTGYKDAFVLEAGIYEFFLGTDVRTADSIGTYGLKALKMVSQLSEACPVVNPFKRIINSGGLYYETTPEATRNLKERILSNLPESIPQTGDQGYKLQDVKSANATDHAISIQDFVAQLSDEELEVLTRGSNDAMFSPQGAPGNTGVFAGSEASLKDKGVPVVCTNDGPSGIRLQAHTTLLPNGIAFASSFNEDLIARTMFHIGKEMKDRGTQVLLAPGMNIHRNPLCGRNFEYFSEDPVVTGNIASAYVKGVQQNEGISAVPKHFACNNQETKRLVHDSRVSPRALREIYLKGFEICVKKSAPDFFMTSYNKLNGVWNYYNYDLVTQILRKEWGFKGIVMTDWWIIEDTSPEFPDVSLQAYRVRSGIDLFMPGSAKSGKYKGKTDGSLVKSLHAEEGITLGEVQQTAIRVLEYCMRGYYE